jgi:predicted GNAT family acetyltransferase
MEIKQVVRGNKGFFIATDDGIEAGVMTYTPAGDDKIIIDHTEVNPAFAGKGVGKKLVMASVQYAREANVKILPLCTFTKGVFDKDKEIQDVLF